MKTIKKLLQIPLLLSLSLVATTSCTQERNLYVVAQTMLTVKANWSESTLSPHGATALVYNSQKAVLPNPFMQPSTTTQAQQVAPDTYNILVFNNLMFSPLDNEFENIDFVGTEHFDTFEAQATLNTKVNSLFKKSDQEVFVNNPEVIAAATYQHKVIEELRDFVIKYEDTDKSDYNMSGAKKDTAQVTPARLTRNVQVTLRVKGYKPKFTIYGTLRGFAQAVNLTTRQPTGSKATHAGFLINRAKSDPDNTKQHILTANPFTSFGPWWNEPLGSNTYTLDILARYNGQGDAFSYSFNVTKPLANVVTQAVEQAIETIKPQEEAYYANGNYNGPTPKMETIQIEVWLTLPEVTDDGGNPDLDVGVDDWGNVVIVPVPIKP